MRVWPLWCDYHLKLLLSEGKLHEAPRLATLSLAALCTGDLMKSQEWFNSSVEIVDSCRGSSAADECFLLASVYLVTLPSNIELITRLLFVF